MKLFFVALMLSVLLWMGCSQPADVPTVIYARGVQGNLSAEDLAALHWLAAHKQFRYRVESSDALREGFVLPEEIVWVHITSDSLYSTLLADTSFWQNFDWLLQQGNPILLTDLAATIPSRMGIEPIAPERQALEIKDDWNFDKKGFQSFRGHPLFEGLFGGAFVFDAVRDTVIPMVGYYGERFPQKGRVVAVEKSYITVHRDRRLIIEYPAARSRILAIGGLVYFRAGNRLKDHLSRLLENAISYLSRKKPSQEGTYWQQFDYIPEQFDPPPMKIKPNPGLHPGMPPASGLSIQINNPQNDFFDLAGRRILVMGYENGGIDEIWVHPLRVIRNFQTALVLKNEVHPLESFPVSLVIRPESLTRSYQTPAGELTETIFAAIDHPAALLHYQWNGDLPVQLLVRFRSDLRWMWPYDEKALGKVYFGYQPENGTFHAKDSSGDFYLIAGASSRPSIHLIGAFETVDYRLGELMGKPTSLNQAYAAALYTLEGAHSQLNFAIAGGSEGRSKAEEAYRRILESPEVSYEAVVAHYQHLLQKNVSIISPDEEFNRLWQWTLVGIDRFWAHTPGVGSGLLAGYSTTARGWDGGQAISGRPGYAWYFGRDSEWSGFAIDAYGDFELVRDQIAFLQKYQDLSGKIFHEISTSGVVHYDAADATPLYIILAAHYLRHSGDVAFIRRSWPHIHKAMEFLYSTDTDEDGLIENTNVGHGWVEGGKLWGAHTTFYLAALWAQALKDAAYLARHCNKAEPARRYERDAESVQEILNRDFWNDSTRFFNYGKWKDGSYNPERTALPAVAMHFNLLEEEKVQNMLQFYSRNQFSSDWGVRILSSNSELFNPTGYHYGSIWPLFTGWTALAEYRYGRAVQGFTHMVNNMLIKNFWAKGFVEEVMHGEIYQPSGVCPHQCWSETNIVHPALEGMVGWHPSAPEQRVLLQPRFPVQWDSVEVRRLRSGPSVVDFCMWRERNQTRYELTLVSGPGLEVAFAPSILEGAHILAIEIDDHSASPDSIRLSRGLLHPPLLFHLSGKKQIVLRRQGGVGIVPQVLRPNPKETSKGWRILDTRWRDPVYEVLLEGPAGQEPIFYLKLFDQQVEAASGAKLLPVTKTGLQPFQVSFVGKPGEYEEKKVSFSLRKDAP